jgi:hypothetical protein
LFLVDDISTKTLLPLIQRFIEPGTLIRSDCWAANNEMSGLPVTPPYIHKTVNHTTNFVDLQTGANTNHVERMRMEAKIVMKKMHGTTENMLLGHLNEFMCRQARGQNQNEAFDNILEDISACSHVHQN